MAEFSNFSTILSSLVWNATAYFSKVCSSIDGHRFGQVCICISGLVVEYIVAIDVTRVRFPADASMRKHGAKKSNARSDQTLGAKPVLIRMMHSEKERRVATPSEGLQAHVAPSQGGTQCSFFSADFQKTLHTLLLSAREWKLTS